jgi:peptidoglycan hydrolase-like protein with peptidoglycan-binding domain
LRMGRRSIVGGRIMPRYFAVVFDSPFGGVIVNFPDFPECVAFAPTSELSRGAADGNYWPKTAAAVLDYKRRRNIVNTAYQTTADDIVGDMTISALDREMLALESQPLVYVDPRLLWRPIRPRPADGRT